MNSVAAWNRSKELASRARKADISCDRDQLPGVCLTRLREVAWIPKPAKPRAKRQAWPRCCNTSPVSSAIIFACLGSLSRRRAAVVGRNSPQRPPHGLYAELISGTSFTTPRGENRRTWTYRIQPSVVHRPYARTDNGLIRSAPFNDVDATPTQLRWSPIPIPKKPTDFIDGMVTMGGNGDVTTQVGMCVHVYAANRSMTERCFYNADGEMLIVPQLGRTRFVTELGIVEAAPGEIVVIPRGLRFRVELPDGPSRGYICENYGVALRLPELGPLGSNGLANVRDFLAPVAAYEDAKAPCTMIAKIPGQSMGSRHGSLAAQRRRLARQFPRRTNTISPASW